MLTPLQLKHFRDKGWLVVEDVFPSEKADAVAKLAWRIGTRKVRSVGAPSIDVEESPDGTVLPRKIRLPFLTHPDFRRFVLNRRLTRIVGQLLGGRPLVFWDHIFMKPPRIGSPTYYHQDNFDFRCTPKDQMLTAWIALDDADEENGCLRYIDGSNHEALHPHRPMPDDPRKLGVAKRWIDLRRESPAIVRKGGVVFHNSHTLHSSRANDSDRWRRGYATHWVTPAVTSSSGVLDDAYFKLYARDLKRG